LASQKARKGCERKEGWVDKIAGVKRRHGPDVNLLIKWTEEVEVRGLGTKETLHGEFGRK